MVSIYQKGNLSEIGLGNSFRCAFGNFSNHSFATENLLILLQDAFSLRFDHVWCRFVNLGWLARTIRSIHESSLILELPFLSNEQRISLKSPPTYRSPSIRLPRSLNSGQKQFFPSRRMDHICRWSTKDFLLFYLFNCTDKEKISYATACHSKRLHFQAINNPPADLVERLTIHFLLPLPRKDERHFLSMSAFFVSWSILLGLFFWRCP